MNGSNLLLELYMSYLTFGAWTGHGLPLGKSLGHIALSGKFPQSLFTADSASFLWFCILTLFHKTVGCSGLQVSPSQACREYLAISAWQWWRWNTQ